MTKRTHKEIKKAILEALDDGKPHSYGHLERKVNTNWKTIRDHCDDLILFEAARPYNGKIIITKIGRDAAKKIKE